MTTFLWGKSWSGWLVCLGHEIFLPTLILPHRFDLVLSIEDRLSILLNIPSFQKFS